MKLSPQQKRSVVRRFMAGESIASIAMDFWRAGKPFYGEYETRDAIEQAIRQHIRAGRKRAGRRK